MIKANLIVLDFETGGSDASQNPITEVALQVLDGTTLQPLTQYENYVKPYNNLTLDPKALEYTGISTALLAERGIDVKTLYTDLTQIFKDAKVGKSKPILVGHNVGFDIQFLEYLPTMFKQTSEHIYSYIEKIPIDTIRLAKLCWMNTYSKDDKSLTLSACCQRADIEITQAHSAMGDVEATVQLLTFFVNRLQSGENQVTEVKKSTKQRNYFQL